MSPLIVVINGNSNSNRIDQVDVKSSTELLCGAFTRVCCINLRRRQDQWNTFCSRLQSTQGKNHPFTQKVKRFDSVVGAALLAASENDNADIHSHIPLPLQLQLLCLLEWDAMKNAMHDRHIQLPMTKSMAPGEVGCTMSHVKLWTELVNNNSDKDYSSSNNSRMLIFEEDATFYRSRGKHHHPNKPFATSRGGGGACGRGHTMGGRRHANREGN
jgi:GR25 family glycosyltransferase involved in LPS biosynthesis